MSTTVHSPSPTDYLSFRSRIPDATDSPFTPFRPTATATPRKPLVTAGHSSPVLLLTTPSPFRRRIDSGISGEDYDMQLDFDDFAGATGFSTPYRPRKSTNAQKNDRFKLSENPHSFRRPPKPPPDDDDDGLFLRSNVGHTSLPLRTPVRHPFEVGMLSTSAVDPNFSHAPKRKVCNILCLLILYIDQTIDQPRLFFSKSNSTSNSTAYRWFRKSAIRNSGSFACAFFP